MPRVSSKNQVTVPVQALREAGLASGDDVVVEAVGDGELRVRRARPRIEDAFGALTGTYGPGYLAALDAEEERR